MLSVWLVASLPRPPSVVTVLPLTRRKDPILPLLAVASATLDQFSAATPSLPLVLNRALTSFSPSLASRSPSARKSVLAALQFLLSALAAVHNARARLFAANKMSGMVWSTLVVCPSTSTLSSPIHRRVQHVPLLILVDTTSQVIDASHLILPRMVSFVFNTLRPFLGCFCWVCPCNALTSWLPSVMLGTGRLQWLKGSLIVPSGWTQLRSLL